MPLRPSAQSFFKYAFIPPGYEMNGGCNMCLMIAEQALNHVCDDSPTADFCQSFFFIQE
jgi:hypothetical protein